MKDEPSFSSRGDSSISRGSRLTRRLSFTSRVRKSFRAVVDGALSTDLVWSATFVVLVALLLGQPWLGRDDGGLVVGQIASADIKARDSFDYIDRALTDERRSQAEDAVATVYVHDTDRGQQLAGQLSSVFQQGREILAQASLTGKNTSEAASRAFRDRISPEALRVLVARRFDAAHERELTAALGHVMGGKVVGNKATLEREATITLRPVRGLGGQRVEEFAGFSDLGEARNQVRQEVARRLDLPREAERSLGDLAASFVDPNVYYDREMTNRERHDAALAVQSSIMRVPQGALLVPRGKELTQEDLDKLAAERASRRPAGPRVLLGLVGIASLLAFFLYRYAHHHQRAYRKVRHLHALMLLMLLGMLILSEAILWLARKVTDNLHDPFNQLESYAYVVPLGAGAILVALLANGRIATVYSSFVAFLFGATNRWDAHLMLWAMLVQCAGVYAITTYRERAALLRAGLVVGGVGAFATLALEAVKGELEPASSSQTLYAAVLAFVGGAVGVGLLISFSLPLLERLFNVLTDVRLLELSNVNNPLLSALAMKAPGSYNHSLVVGTLAEEAAKAIGANSLFCRVAAFYHDIGKMNKAEYYVENQRGVNPHDRLSPSMSALIIASHVKDGIRMAREAGLPEQIVDIIPQHHGTKLMTYFYEKAKTNADPSLGPVKKEDFRYPGPKPQTKEAAIFMLADAVEAAARTIDDPTPHRLKEMIRKVTNAVVVDGELDSCDLTFSDLDKIQDAFLRCLASMHHHRVDYPGFDFSGPRMEGRHETRAELKTDPGSRGGFRVRKIARSS